MQPWIESVAVCAMSYKSWLSENFCNYITLNIWPLNSPERNSFDYYKYGAVEWETNKTPYDTKDKLKVRMTATFTNLKKGNRQKGMQENLKSFRL